MDNENEISIKKPYDIIYFYSDGTVAHKEKIEAYDRYDAKCQAEQIAEEKNIQYAKIHRHINPEYAWRYSNRKHPKRNNSKFTLMLGFSEEESNRIMTVANFLDKGFNECLRWMLRQKTQELLDKYKLNKSVPKSVPDNK